jgi:hypothetical protein
MRSISRQYDFAQQQEGELKKAKKKASVSGSLFVFFELTFSNQTLSSAQQYLHFLSEH